MVLLPYVLSSYIINFEWVLLSFDWIILIIWLSNSIICSRALYPFLNWLKSRIPGRWSQRVSKMKREWEPSLPRPPRARAIGALAVPTVSRAPPSWGRTSGHTRERNPFLAPFAPTARPGSMIWRPTCGSIPRRRAIIAPCAHSRQPTNRSWKYTSGTTLVRNSSTCFDLQQVLENPNMKRWWWNSLFCPHSEVENNQMFSNFPFNFRGLRMCLYYLIMMFSVLGIK